MLLPRRCCSPLGPEVPHSKSNRVPDLNDDGDMQANATGMDRETPTKGCEKETARGAESDMQVERLIVTKPVAEIRAKQ